MNDTCASRVARSSRRTWCVPPLQRGRASASAVVALFFASLLAGCGDGGTEVKPVASVVVTVATPTLVVGQTIQATATTLDDAGTQLTGRQVAWQSSAPTVADVDGAGVITARGPGTSIITATSEAKQGQVTVTVIPPPVASVVVTPPEATVAVGATVQLSAALADAAGNPISGRTITWQSTDATKATVTVDDPVGDGTTATVTGVAEGTALVFAQSEGKADTTTVTVVPPPNAPLIDAVAPDVIVPGATIAVTGSNFGGTPAENAVTINGAAATVTAASPTQLTVVVPTTGLACEATSNGLVAVTVAGVQGTKTHPVQVATQRALAVGQSMALFGGDVRCNEFAQTGGRYFISVFNSGKTAGSTSSFQLRGAASVVTQAAVAAVAAVPPTAPLVARAAPYSALSDWPAGFDRGRIAAEAHRRNLEFNRRTVREFGPQLHSYLAQRGRTGVRQSSATLPGVRPQVSGNVGDVSDMVILDESATQCSSTSFQTIQVRTVYSGTRSIVVEDVTNPLAGTMNSYFEDIGREFDDDMFDILQTNFGNPLALDADLDANGKVIMMFSKKINDRGGVAGYVLNCDFLPKDGAPEFGALKFPGSNEGEVFYAIVPTSPNRGFDSDNATLNPDEWRRLIRAVIIHEVKHVTSFAEHISRNTPELEETWLEEGTAMHAEELWARTVFGNTWKGNATYAQTIFCEVRPTTSACIDKPVAMLDHFARVYDYLNGPPESLSPFLTDRDEDPNATFYGSTWWLVRWAIDQYGASDAAFLKALTQEPSRTGIANLEARTGHTWAELLADWTLVNAVDDYPGFTPQRTQVQEPSWNARDIFNGMFNDFGPPAGRNVFTKQYPLTPRPLTFGSFSIGEGTGVSVRAGSAAIFELSGTQAGKQFLDLRSPSGDAPASTLGVSVVRVQ